MSSPALTELTVADPPDRWAALGFALDGAACLVGSVTLRLGGDPPGAGLTAWSLSGAGAPGEVDGLALLPADPAAVAPRAHPNGVLGVDHVVVGTPDHARTVAALEAIGLPLRLLRPGPGGRLYAFLRAGEAVVEVIGPPEPEGDGPASFWGVAFALADIDAAAAALGEELVRPPRDAVQPGRRIATVRRAAGLSTRVAFMTPRG